MSRPTGFAPPKRHFIGKSAPPGYVAGIGRGATGFTTRSDIGPAREAVATRSAQDDDGAGPSMKRIALAKGQQDDNLDEDEYLNESNYDEFAGYGGSLFNKVPYEEDDEEADKIYDTIDKHLDERGKALREAKTRQELEAYRQKRPKIQQQFMDLKANLRQVSEEEWLNIPDVGDARNRKQRVARQEKFTPIPDSLLAHQARLASGGEKLVYIDPKAMNQPDDDDDDEDDNNGNATQDKESSIDKKFLKPLDDTQGLNIDEMSEFRSSYMSMKLSRVSNANADNKEAQLTNPQDYLTNLQSMVPNQITDTATVNEYRKQFTSLRVANPTFQNAWIASVRLEEAAGKLKTARSLILEACEKCPKSSDLWLEAIRLHPPDISKALMVKALKEIPRSVKLWIKAADLEDDEEAKRRVYAKAREIIPKSVLLWKKSVEIEPPTKAQAILREAVECCPDAVELWLALAKLQPYEEARQVLIKASEKNPTDRSIWITAAKLQEQVGNNALVKSIIKRSIEELAEKGVTIDRDEWLREANDAARANFRVTCQEIIKRIIGWNLANEDDKLKIWMEDVKKFIASNSIDCARAVFESIVEDRRFCKQESIWQDYANFERQHGTGEKLVEVLRRSIDTQHCIKSESLWLSYANEKRHSLDECRQILSDALDANPDSERIVIAAVELECDNGNHQEARRILADACRSAKTAQLVMKSAKLEWSLGNLDEAIRLLKGGVDEYKNCPDFYLALGEIAEQKAKHDEAKSWYSSGLKFNPTSVTLWISMAHLEERTGFIARARSRLETARLRNPRNSMLWLESAQLEMRSFMSKQGQSHGQRGRPDTVTTILARGIKECKNSPNVEKLYEMQADINSNKFLQANRAL